MTRAVQELLGQLRNEVLGEDMYDYCKCRAESSVKGLRTGKITWTLDVSIFPGENLPNCSCAEASASEGDDIVHFFGEEKRSKMLELANVRRIGVTAGGSLEFLISQTGN